ncbi:MAG TPA: hypothetical protein VF476_03230 [Chitinophagaceae bacterium]
MDSPFEIIFDFAVDNSDFIINLRATATLHHSDPYYVVDDFHLTERNPQTESPSVLPRQEIKLLQRDGKRSWVHKDSELETMLSVAIGKAIDERSADLP